VPFSESKAKKNGKLPTGQLERNDMSEDAFREQFYNFKRYGVFMDPSKGGGDYIEKEQTGDHFLDFSIKKVSTIFFPFGKKI
jgi:hypothetical protein